jgi:hypothetical protein
VTVTSAAASPGTVSQGASLELIGLRRRFGSVVALDGLTFSVPPAWQAAISAVLVAAGTVWMARIAATIYGRSILRTGSRVRLREVLGRAPAS